jgi:hypothetical protein
MTSSPTGGIGKVSAPALAAISDAADPASAIEQERNSDLADGLRLTEIRLRNTDIATQLMELSIRVA